jgi:hypothetical protein
MCGAKPRCEIVEFRNKIRSRQAPEGGGPHSGGDGSLWREPEVDGTSRHDGCPGTSGRAVGGCALRGCPSP